MLLVLIYFKCIVNIVIKEKEKSSSWSQLPGGVNLCD